MTTRIVGIVIAGVGAAANATAVVSRSPHRHHEDDEESLIIEYSFGGCIKVVPLEE